MLKRLAMVMSVVTLMSVSVISLQAHEGKHRGKTIIENRTSMGDGHIESFVRLNRNGKIKALGVLISEEVLESLPTEKNDGTTCWDSNEDGILDRDTECAAGHVRILYLPKLADLPFKYIQFNWQRDGHGPVGIYDKGHFDMHVFIQDNLDRLAIRPGPCPAIINCDDVLKAAKELPEEFVPVGMTYQMGGAGQAYMGGHMADESSQEWHGTPLTHAHTYGVYDGHVTFIEPLVNTEWLKTKPNECAPILQAPEVEVSGYYPKKFCTRFFERSNKYAMTMENFEYREALTN